MANNYLRKITIIAALCACFYSKAQVNEVLKASQFGGISNVSFNPAIADNPFLVDINLISVGAGVENNYVGITSKVLTNQSLINDPNFQSNELKERLNGNPKSAFVGMQVQGPLSFMVSFGKKRNNKNALGFSWHTNSVTNIDGVSQQFARIAYYGIGSKADSIQPFNYQNLTNQNFGTKSLLWSDFGATYSRVLYDEGAHMLKAGVTGKALIGLAGGYVSSKNINYRFRNYDTLDIYNSNISYGHSAAIAQLENVHDVSQALTDIFNNKSKTSIGADLGVVYEWRPDKDKYQYDMDCEKWYHNDVKKYKLSAGFSVIDIGRVVFAKPNDVSSYYADIQGWVPGKAGINSVASFDSVIHSLSNNFKSTGANSFKMWLPTRFNLYLDYNIYKGLGLNLNGVISPNLTKDNNQVHYPTSIALVPRYDMKWVGVYIPLTYNQYGNFGAGFGLRAGPIFVTSSNIITAFAYKYTYAANIQAGVKITIPYLDQKDRDKDGVSNRKDKCKKVKGTCATHGCPDRDGDGITDDVDQCPDIPGPARTHGCPDRDSDGVYDMNDSCPDVPGPAALNGCPDTDGDGLYDYEDSCPMVKGPIENHGCPWPDTDGDGIPDKDDACPTVFGLAENHGCPALTKKEVQTIKYAFDNLEFETGKDKIKMKSFISLDGLANLLLDKGYGLKIDGHTDNVGAAEMNMELSVKRAEAVKAYLMSKGVPGDKLQTEGFGLTKPIADNNTAAGRQQNRRVEMHIIYNK